MKRKILSAIVAATMLSSSMATVGFAEDRTLKEFFTDNGVPRSEKTIEVKTDIEVKKDSSSIYVDGPLTASASSVTGISDFDFCATLDMQPVRDAFKKYMELARTLINTKAASDSEKTSLLAELDAQPVTGQFVVEIQVPGTNFTVPDTFMANGMNGFSSEKNQDATDVYVETVERTKTEGVGNDTIKITVDVKDGITAKVLEDNLENYLDNLSLTCEGVDISAFSTYQVIGKMTGFTNIGDPFVGKINYVSRPMTGVHNPDGMDENGEYSSATIKVSRRSSGGGGGVYPEGTTPGQDDNVKDEDTIDAIFDIDGDTELIPTISSKEGEESLDVKFSEIEKPKKDGYAFDGFYTDKNYTNKVTEDTVTIDKDTIFYGKWVKTEAPDELVSDKHMAYVIGYPDGTVQPEDNITREEVASIFYRLLTDESRDAIFTDKNNFSDVQADRWSNKAISSMTNGGYLKGYPDGTFKPQGNITRAEFVTIVSRFNDTVESSSKTYPDITGHWAEQYILTSLANNWVDGYSDGTFKPEQNITRAEVMTVINRMLVRYVNEKGLHADAKQWPDNPKTASYYYNVLEATNAHDFERQEDGFNEIWTKVLANNVWEDKPTYEDVE